MSQLPEKKNDIFILCCYAYCGDFLICNTTDVDALFARLDMPIDRSAYMECCRLRLQGYLRRFTESNGIARYFIEERYELPLLEKLYADDDKRELLRILEESEFQTDLHHLQGKSFRHWLLHVCGIRENKRAIFPNTFAWRQLGILTAVMDQKLWAPGIKPMSSDNFTRCAQNFISSAFKEGRQLEWDQLWEVQTNNFQAHDSPSHASYPYGTYTTDYIREYMALYCLLMTGRERLQDPIDNSWGLLYTACVKLYKGDYTSAVEDFDASLRKYDGDRHTDRLIFDDFTLNYLYAMALMLDTTPASKKKLKHLIEESSMRFDTLYNNTLIPLMKYVSEGVCFEANAMAISYQKTDAVSAALINIIFRFATSCRQDLHTPTCRYALTMMEADKERSFINRLYVHEQWEVALDDISTQLTSDAPTKEIQRIVYLIEDSGDIIPSIQRQDAHGKWCNSLKALWVRGKKHDIPRYADDEDRKVLSLLPLESSRFRSPNGYLLLAGKENVFRREIVKGEGLQRVNIRIEKPYLIINEFNDESFTINSNVTIASLEKSEDVCVRRRDENNYEVIQLQSWEKSIFRNMLKVKHIPAKAKDKLLQTIQLLKERTDIYSSLTEKDLQTLRGDSRIVVRIYPRQHNNNLWAIQLKIVPYIPNGYVELPGEGNDLYMVTDNEGRPRQLKRDFQEEIDNRNLFLQFFAKEIEKEEQVLNADIDYEALMERCENIQFSLEELLHIVEWIQGRPDHAVLEMMKGSKFKVSGSASMKSIHILTSKKSNWLSVVGEVKINQTKVLSLSEFISHLDQGIGDYIRLDEQTFCKVSKDLKKKVHLLQSILQRQDDELLAHQSALGTLDEMFDDELITTDLHTTQLREMIRQSYSKNIEVSPALNGELRPYQQGGFEWLARLSDWAGGACLADDMGLGKTIQTIALMLYRKERGASLVIAPASVVANWRKEICSFAPTLSVCVLNETPDRNEAITKAGSGTVIVASYGLLITMQKKLANKRWDIVCLDEAHIIKNHLTKTFRTSTTLQADCRLVLTGTPVQNNLTELWSLFQFILPGLLGSFKTFTRRYVDAIDNYEKDDERLECLRHIVSPFMLRRTKEQVLDDLPKIDDNVRYIRLSDEEMAIYESTREKAESNLNLLLNNVTTAGHSTITALAMLTTLREVACSCSLVMQGWRKRSSKEEALLDLLQEIDLDNNGVLIFSQFTSFLAEIQRMLDKEKMEYLYLDGATSLPHRQQLIDRYQSGDSPSIFLISLKAGGLGLNLTRANYVIHLDPWWNPSIEQQATDRAYRIGQKKDVTAYHLIACHTVEEKILELHQEKRHLSDEIMAGSSANDRLTAEEILSLLKRDEG
jgi:superfamily II DNA or RNA helicase